MADKTQYLTLGIDQELFGIDIRNVREILDTIRTVCAVEPITVETHDRGLAVFERYKFSLYDSMLIAAALIAGAKIIYSQDLQHGQVIDSQLRITNPF